jgi:hypothetical protein
MKILLLFFLVLLGCKKEYNCKEQIITTVNGIVVSNTTNIIYSETDLTTSDCFNYIWQSNDTIRNYKTDCK